ncbi:MAG: ATP-binding cassette domain-containing protein [Clostridiales Family XIII bacterium]|jgi:osmoprotectant transport system ATP-binding protein|nr:ATP-binding cassette domain-containing protein [Clostridiales Family XIII bacterium]
MTEILRFEDVVKKFPGADYNAIDHVDLTVDDGEFIAIIGTSGSGKTTLLKMVNRLYEPDQGSIALRGVNIAEKDPVQLRRGIGYVIQQVGLFPHMTVKGNIATVPRILKWDAARIDERVDKLLKLVNLDPDEYRDRFPSQLSGGQQQRVGLARALAVDPVVMLLDEPFGAIDAINRATLQDELMAIHRESRKTYLFVTHDISEAFKLATRILIMHNGKAVQYDTPDAIMRAPAGKFVEELLGKR